MASEQLEQIKQASMAIMGEFIQTVYPEVHLKAMREMVRRMAHNAEMAGGVSSTVVDVDGCKAEWVCAGNSDPDNRLLYLHGGGYVAGDIDMYRPLASHLAKATACSVLNLEYRLAPEYPYDTPQADAVRAFCWMKENGPSTTSKARHTFVSGDSAGGGLTLSTLFGLRDQGLGLPDAAMPICAAVDMSQPFEVMPKEHTAPVMAMTKLFTGEADPTHPVISPLFGDLHGLPPLLMQIGGAEPGLVSNVRFEERARAAGVDVTLEIWPEMPHVWHMHAPFLPEANQAINRIGEFVKQFTN